MNIIGDTIMAIGDHITVLCYATKYWLRGEDWEDDKIKACRIGFNTEPVG